jgi:signal transduction histidine kinase
MDKLNILMVDDQPAKLLTYEVILGELGENLLKATSAREALEQLLKTEIAVILLDVGMPEINGFELADMIRKHPRYQKTAIIFISAIYMTDSDLIKGYARGAVDYIQVPFRPELLRAKVSVFTDLYRKTQQLERLSSEMVSLSNRLIAAQDDQRRRIARELHDGLGQELAAAKMMADGMLDRNRTVEEEKKIAAEVSAIIDSALQQVRTLSHLLHPPLLDEVGLQPALKCYVEGLAKRSGIHTSIDTQPAEFPRLPRELESAIFRIIQEALTNVFRHSEAREASVGLAMNEGQLIVTVRDDGKGIADHIAEFRPESIGVGLGGMRQRVKDFGGELRLRNVKPGTLVEVVVPVESRVLQTRLSNSSSPTCETAP